jgi:hypothetical protein
MKKTALALVLLSATAITPALAQAKRGPSTEQERSMALTLIDDLEKNPLGQSATEERSWLTTWLIEIPDIHVGFCLDLLPALPKGNKNDANILATQLMYSGARYAIEHPGSTAQDENQYITGVQGTLRMYEVLLAQKPKDRLPALDDLLKQRAAGTLEAYVKAQAAAHCKK